MKTYGVFESTVRNKYKKLLKTFDNKNDAVMYKCMLDTQEDDYENQLYPRCMNRHYYTIDVV